MRTQHQFLSDYAQSHRNPTNQVIHFICVPVIFFASVGLLWLIPVGRWVGLEPELAYWVNGASFVAAFAAVFYGKMSRAALLAMALWFALAVTGIVAIQAAGWPLLGICVSLWVMGWAVQFWGHKVEGAKPSFSEDLLFLLIGPLFVMREIYGKFK